MSRLTLEMTALDLYMALSEGNPGALNVLMQLEQKFGAMALITVDSKALYGSRIWMLYKDVCGEDIERFDYHLCMELPNQETGRFSITGPYSTKLTEEDRQVFWEARKHGKPNSFWALENPPQNRNYKFPLTAEGKENEV